MFGEESTTCYYNCCCVEVVVEDDYYSTDFYYYNYYYDLPPEVPFPTVVYLSAETEGNCYLSGELLALLIVLVVTGY